MTDRRSGVLGQLVAPRRALALAAVAGLAIGGCAQNPCDKAAQHEIDCAVAPDGGTGASSGGPAVPGTDCSGVTECDSSCIEKAPCEELQNYADPKASAALRACLELCSTAAAQTAN